MGGNWENDKTLFQRRHFRRVDEMEKKSLVITALSQKRKDEDMRNLNQHFSRFESAVFNSLYVSLRKFDREMKEIAVKKPLVA